MAGSLPSSSSNFHLNWAVGAWHGAGAALPGPRPTQCCLQVTPETLEWLAANEMQVHISPAPPDWVLKGKGRGRGGGGEASDNQVVKCASIYVAAASPRFAWWAALPAVSRTCCSRFLLFLISFLPVILLLNKQVRASSPRRTFCTHPSPSSLLLPNIQHRDPGLYCFRSGSTIIKLLRLYWQQQRSGWSELLIHSSLPHNNSRWTPSAAVRHCFCILKASLKQYGFSTCLPLHFMGSPVTFRNASKLYFSVVDGEGSIPFGAHNRRKRTQTSNMSPICAACMVFSRRSSKQTQISFLAAWSEANVWCLYEKLCDLYGLELHLPRFSVCSLLSPTKIQNSCENKKKKGLIHNENSQ